MTDTSAPPQKDVTASDNNNSGGCDPSISVNSPDNTETVHNHVDTTSRSGLDVDEYDDNDEYVDIDDETSDFDTDMDLQGAYGGVATPNNSQKCTSSQPCENTKFSKTDHSQTRKVTSSQPCSVMLSASENPTQADNTQSKRPLPRRVKLVVNKTKNCATGLPNQNEMAKLTTAVKNALTPPPLKGEEAEEGQKKPEAAKRSRVSSDEGGSPLSSKPSKPVAKRLNLGPNQSKSVKKPARGKKVTNSSVDTDCISKQFETMKTLLGVVSKDIRKDVNNTQTSILKEVSTITDTIKIDMVTCVNESKADMLREVNMLRSTVESNHNETKGRLHAVEDQVNLNHQEINTTVQLHYAELKGRISSVSQEISDSGQDIRNKQDEQNEVLRMRIKSNHDELEKKLIVQQASLNAHQTEMAAMRSKLHETEKKGPSINDVMRQGGRGGPASYTFL